MNVIFKITRGDIFYIDRLGDTTGCEQTSGRPAVIVSNNKNNEYSPTVEIVYCTTKPKEDLPTHCIIRSTRLTSTVLCEQVTTVDKQRLGDYIGSCTEEEMQRINTALLISLGFGEDCKCQPNPFLREKSVIITEKNMVEAQFASVCCQRDTYKNLYEALLDKLLIVGTGNK